jgi:hypothetical protein
VTTIREGRLAFDFPDGWQAAKYDEWVYYTRHFQSLCGGAKGVDIVAVEPRVCLWLIEVKDFRHAPRQKSLDLVEELTLKVRDTLAGLAAARLRAADERERELAGLALRCPELKFVLHLEQPRLPSRLHPSAAPANLMEKLKQLLRAIDPHPRVTSLSVDLRFGWVVREI